MYNILFVILVGVLFFIIGREIICWYFKINKIVSLLENIEENTRPKDVKREPYNKDGLI